MRYAVVIEKGPVSCGAYVPDLPGCVAAGKTVAEVKRLIRAPSAFTWKAFAVKEFLPRSQALFAST